MINKDQVLNIILTARLVVNSWDVTIWSGCGKGLVAVVKRDERLGELDRDYCIEKAWKVAWFNIQQDLIEKMSE